MSIPATGDLDAEEELNRFLRSHRVVSVQKELVAESATACWCFCIEYLPGGKPGGDGGKGRSRIDYKDVLSEADFAVFARLREERKRLAANEAVPVYAVCTNEQLAEMARSRATTIAALKTIEGFGDAKADKYGESLLAAIRDSGGPQTESGDETAGQRN